MYKPTAPITMASAAEALADGLRAIDAGETEISLAALAVSDSSAVAVCVAWQRRAAEKGIKLRFSDIPESIASFADLYGVDALLSGFPDNADTARYAL